MGTTAVATLAQNERQSVQMYGDDRSMRLQIRSIRSGLPNMRDPDKVSDEAVIGLIVASRFSGLNPYAGEIFWTPKGIQTASKIKVSSAITAAQRRGDTLSISFDKINEGMPQWDEGGYKRGDEVWQCTIISSKSRISWTRERIAMIDELKALGYTRAEMEAKLVELFPCQPKFTAISYVGGSEDFGNKGKFDAFTNADRAKKRALQKCLNLNGFAAPDTRNYGGQAVDKTEEDAVQGEYTVQTPAQTQAQIDPAFAAAVEEAVDDEPLPAAPNRDAKGLGRLESESLVEDTNTPVEEVAYGMGNPPAPVQDGDANSATAAKTRITYWASEAKKVMGRAPVGEAALVAAGIEAAKVVYASRTATIGDLNRAANALREFVK